MHPISILASGFLVLTLGTLAWACDGPMLAPPLGVTAYLSMRDPDHPSSRPRNIVLGHTLGIAAGFLATHLTGVAGAPSVVEGPFLFRHALASGLAVAGTAALTEGLRCPHPPAAATTLVVSLGILSGPAALGGFFLGTLATSTGAALLRIGLPVPGRSTANSPRARPRVSSRSPEPRAPRR